MNRRWKILIISGVAVIVALLIPVVHHYQLRAATEDYLAELKAKGEPLDLAQVIPTPLPPERNSAPLFWKAASLLNTNWDVLNSNPPPTMRAVAPGKAMIGWMQPDIRGGDGTNSWDDIKDALAQNKEALELLAQLTNNSAFDFNLQYSRRFELLLTNLVVERRAVQILSASAISNLHLGDAASAASNIQTILILVNGTADERTIISQLVRMAEAQIASTATWELLQSTNVTDEQLAGLEADWSRLEFIRALERTFLVDREGDITTFLGWRKSQSEFRHFFDLQRKAHDFMGVADDEDTFVGRMKIKAGIFMWRYWWSYPDELRYLKGYEVLADTVRSLETNGSFHAALERQSHALDQLGISKLNDSLDSLFSGQTDFHAMMSGGIVTLSQVVRRALQVEAAKNIAVTAIALKRYQLKHGGYPPNLASLVPECIPKIPADPADGQPLRYRLNPDGTFLLYSVGENGIDDGGNPSFENGAVDFSWENPQNLDWVWPQPATQDEIQKYYNKLSFSHRTPALFF